ncbi:aldehyde reductase [Chitinophaga sp. Mgbs1]|uniref:Aldehyde reductase n=1 Tax=Chitinophaga solisilvae TaxID=1233460 RepID=A0A3S1JHM6_9BACT|nr:aldehyde reductase [Chitinophaga solisilvae]
METRVLVTGGSGFVGSHCILQLLHYGYRVRAAVRSLQREPAVRALLQAGGAHPGNMLSFVEADLHTSEGWPEAVTGCDYVLHIASPFPVAAPKNEDDLIIPARKGVLHVLRAARDAGVKRVVLTSSFAAIGYTPKKDHTPFTEKDWTNPDVKSTGAYIKSKTIAERAAWEFMSREGGDLELSVVNPVGIFGPVPGPDMPAAVHIIQRMLSGAMPGLPRIAFGVVDVRDVADIHLRAMTNPAARGERFLAAAGEPMTLAEIAQLLKGNLGEAAARVPSRSLPDWLIRFAALFNPEMKTLRAELGVVRKLSNEKAKSILGWEPRSNDETILATAESLIQRGLTNPHK